MGFITNCCWKEGRSIANRPGYRAFFFNGSEKGPFVVTDISLAGVGFEVNDDISFKEGEKILVEFNLDDMAKSFVRREVVVRSIRGRKIGAEFHEMDPAESLYKALKFYLC